MKFKEALHDTAITTILLFKVTLFHVFVCKLTRQKAVGKQGFVKIRRGKKKEWTWNLVPSSLVLFSHATRGEILHTNWEHPYWVCLLTKAYVKRTLICCMLTLAGCQKRYFSHSCQCEPPKANTSSKAMSWAEPCLWLLVGFQPIFT